MIVAHEGGKYHPVSSGVRTGRATLRSGIQPLRGKDKNTPASHSPPARVCSRHPASRRVSGGAGVRLVLGPKDTEAAPQTPGTPAPPETASARTEPPMTRFRFAALA